MWYYVAVMANKIIQVPVDETLLENLDAVSRQRSQSRSALIREACRQYMRAIEEEEQDRLYAESYRRSPEPASENKALLELAAQAFDPDETW